jgi:hypothetical protein
LPDTFYPYQQEQSVLEQEAAMGDKMQQQQGPQHGTPWGALLGGLSDAIGKGAGVYKQTQALQGQRALGARAQTDAVNRISSLGKMSEEQMKQQAMWDALGLSPAAML